MNIVKNYMASTTPQRIPVQHLPQESDSCALVWKSASGFDSSTVSIPPRAVWFNTVDEYECTTYFTTNIPGLTGETTVTLNVAAPGFESGAFKTIKQVGGTELASASAAYFVW